MKAVLKASLGVTVSLLALGVSGMAVAQTAPAQTSPSNDQSAPDQSAPKDQADKQDDTTAPDIVVTGTSIRGIAPVGSNPIQIDRAAIDNIGARTTSEMLTRVPQVAQFNTTSQPQAANFVGLVAPISLRADFGIDSTLILVNGHRFVPAGTSTAQPDVSAIPPAAIQRIEILTDGASAVYGSDAVAGVINFITRRDFDGAESTFRYGMVNDYTTWDADQIIGHHWSTGSFMITGQYSGHSHLTAKSRPQFTNIGTLYGLSPSCPVASFTGSPGCDEVQLGGDILPEEKRWSVMASVRQELSSSMEAWADLSYSNLTRYTDVFQPALPPSLLGPDNPYNATGAYQVLFYRPSTEFGNTLRQFSSIHQGDATLGLDTKLGGGWANTSFAYYGKTWNKFVGPGTDNFAYQTALLSSDPALAFDPFNHQTSDATLAAILDGTDNANVNQTSLQISTKFDGPLFTLPGGAVRMSIGGEVRREGEKGTHLVGSPNSQLQVGTGYLGRGIADTSRTVESAYGEVFVPIVGAGNAMPLVQALSLSAAVRYDHYSDFGGTTNPKFGIDWTPIRGIRLFGNWSKSFQAPVLGDTEKGAIDTQIVPEFAASYLGPFGPGFEQYFGQPGLVVAGGGQNLKPQTATNYAFGIDASPHLWSGFHLSGDYYHIHFKNYIAIPYPGGFTDPTLRQYGILAPVVNGAVVPFTGNSPEVTQYTSRLPVQGIVLPSQIYWISILQRVNVSEKLQSGIDFNVSQTVPVAGGYVIAGFAGNYILNDAQAATSAAPFVVTGDRHLFLHNISLEFDKGGFKIGGSRSHLSTPVVVAGIPGLSFNIVNFYAAYKLPAPGFLHGVELTANFDNALNATAPFNAAIPGGGFNGYPLGRVFTFGIRKHW